MSQGKNGYVREFCGPLVISCLWACHEVARVLCRWNELWMNLEKRRKRVACRQHSEAVLNSRTWVRPHSWRNHKMSHPVSCPSPHFFIAFAVWRVNRQSQSMSAREGRGGRVGELESAYGNLGFFKNINSIVPFIFRGWGEPSSLADEHLPTKWITPTGNIGLFELMCVGVANGKGSRLYFILTRSTGRW